MTALPGMELEGVLSWFESADFDYGLAFLNRHRAKLALAISMFFLGSFLVAASVFYNTIPTGDYLTWVFENYRNIWPETLWAPYNQHRLVVPKLLVWADTALLRGKTLSVVGLAEIMVLMILASLVNQVSRVVVDPTNRLLAFSGLCIALLRGIEISVVRYPSNINHVLVAFFFIVGLEILFSEWARTHLYMALASLCLVSGAVVCSAANGLVALPIFIALFHYHFRWPAGSLSLGSVCAVLATAYLIGFDRPGAGAGVAMELPNPWMVFLFLINYIGSPWKIGFINFSNGTYVGAVLTVFAGTRSASRFLRGKISCYSLEAFALAIMTFIAGSGFLVACGRVQLGLDQARSGRFFTEVEVMQCATVILLLLWLVEGGKARHTARFSVLILTIVALLMVPEQIREFDDSVKAHRMLETTRARLTANPNDQSALVTLASSHTDARVDVAVLIEHHIYGF